jgi:hypothetical protein
MLDEFIVYQKSTKLWDLCWNDTEILSKDFRGKEIARQMIRGIGSISATLKRDMAEGRTKNILNSLKLQEAHHKNRLDGITNLNFYLIKKL